MKITGKRDCLGYRLLREENGFTLPEMLVTMMIMLIVLFALYNIFDMSIRVFRFGNDEVEAVENARLGLEKMEREIRAAYPYDNTTTPPLDDDMFKTWTPNRITFGNELTNDRRVLCPAPPPNPPPQCETITYDVYRTADGTYALGRASSNGGTRQPVVEFVNYTGATSTGLEFKYLDGSGNQVTEESQIQVVRITLDVLVEGGAQDGTQTLTTDVDLRNRGG